MTLDRIELLWEAGLYNIITVKLQLIWTIFATKGFYHYVLLVKASPKILLMTSYKEKLSQNLLTKHKNLFINQIIVER